MKRLLCLLVVALTLSTPLFAETAERYIVATRRPAKVTGLRIIQDAAIAQTHDVRSFSTVNAFAASLTSDEVAALKKSPDVQYVSHVVERHIEGWAVSPASTRRFTATPAASRYAKSQTIPYGIDLIKARDVWTVSRGGGGIVNVAVVDTGIDYNHPELKTRYAGGFNYFSQNNDPKDDHSHGTHVSGTIAAADNEIGVVGVAPDVRLWAVKVLQANGGGTDETVAGGVEWVINKKKEIGGNWIMSLSLGAAVSSELEVATFQHAIDAGIIVVAAAGNRGFATLDFPAAYQGVIAVSAIDETSTIASFSSFGSGVGFAAPGVHVLSSVPVGTADTADVVSESGATSFDGFPIAGSARGDVSGQLINCGYGRESEFPESVRGNIALIRRGADNTEQIQFRTKARNAKTAGATAVVIMANDDRADQMIWTLYVDALDKTFEWPVVVSVNKKQGDKLVTMTGKEAFTVGYRLDDYAFFQGTSMSTPHVSGAAALVWSLNPQASAEQVKLAMKLTADDLGKPGYDDVFGYGRIDAIAAAKYLAPIPFNAPPPPPLDPKRRRQGH